MSLTKERIVSDIFNQVGLGKSKARSVIENTFEIIKESLERGEDILISGFGKFAVKAKHERRGRNPQTSQDLRLRARKVVVFKPSGVLRKKINM
jgi:integration host factor subunit alpha